MVGARRHEQLVEAGLPGEAGEQVEQLGEVGADLGIVGEQAVDAGIVNAEGEPQLSKAQGPVRVAISGRTVGPPLWESLAVLGRERTLDRLRAMQAKLP